MNEARLWQAEEETNNFGKRERHSEPRHIMSGYSRSHLLPHLGYKICTVRSWMVGVLDIIIK